MNISELFGQFCKEVFPNETIEIHVETNVEEFERLYPSIVQIIRKDNEFFKEQRIVFGRNLSSLEESFHENIWKNLVPCMIASFLHGDIKTKVSKISDLIKNIWNASGQENEEVTRILNDEKSSGHFQEIIDFVLNSRLAKIFKSIVESFNMADFELNIKDPAELIELLKDFDNPIIKKIMDKIHTKIKEKMQHGEFTQQILVAEIEAIKAKCMGLFGNIFNEALGGRRGDTPASTLMGNSPEARRQRMLARMQRKVRDKNSK